jgi:hypothetical protein
VAVQGRLDRNRGEEVLGKLIAKVRQLFERQRLQLASRLQSKSNRIADLLMRLTEGNSLV